MTTFFRLLHADDKDAALRVAVDADNAGEPSTDVYRVDPASFKQVPGSPFAYWVGDRIRRLFRELPAFEGDGRTVRVGLQTSDDFRFVRCWWEVAPATILDGGHGPKWRVDLPKFQAWCKQRTFAGKDWLPFAKGGEFSPFYADLHLVVNWESDGEEMKAFEASVIRNPDFYVRPGLTWPLRSQVGFSLRAYPAGSVFGHKGPVAFVESDQLSASLALMNSAAFQLLISLQMAFGSYEVGVIQRTPVALPKDDRLAELARQAVDRKRLPERANELSHLFVSPYLDAPPANLDDLQAEIDDLAFQLYGITAEARAAMEQRAEPDAVPSDDDADEEAATATEDLSQRTRDHLSHTVGCVLGRWDSRFATGEKKPPDLPDPFDPLPVCSPGMFQGDDGLPLTKAPEGYPLRIDGDGILVDDIDHTDDIVRRVREVLETIWKKRADAIEKESCEILGVKELRDYFRKPGKGGFWDDHVSRYTKSRRKAPIYWLLQSSKKNYAIWLYYHRLDKDLLFKALVNYVEPKIRLEDSRLETLRTQNAAAGDSGREAKRLGKEVERQEEFLSELRDFEDKLRRAANLHLEPDLNDGVVLNIAPLHELVPWNPAKTYWQELLDGKYEWSSIGKQLREKKIIATDEHR